MKRFSANILFLSVIIYFSSITTESYGQLSFADHWEFIGTAVEEPGYTIWGTSPILGDDGKVHLFVARWPCELKVDPGWRTHSEIAHYVGDSPEGPFVFSDVALKGDIEGSGRKAPANPAIHKVKKTSRFAPHNPAIHKADSLYVLLYIANRGIEEHPANQFICMAISESLYGPWKDAGENGVILRPPENPDYWNYNSGNGVNNPAFLQHPDGGYFLYFKSKMARMGLAVSENLEGPYVQLPYPVTANDRNIEDGYAFIHQGKFALLTTDNHGMIEEGGGILWTSEDGIHFNNYEKGFHHINDYTDVDFDKVAIHYGPGGRDYAKFERPQVLLREGKPWYLYVPSGTNIYGGECTVSYVLKYNDWSEPYRNWSYYPDLVIPPNPGIPGFEDIEMTDVPTVFQLPSDKKWYMSFIGFDGNGYQSFIAESEDLIHWGNYRLAMGYGPEGEFDYGGVVLGAYLYESYDIRAPRVLLKTQDGRPKMQEKRFYSLYGAYPRQGGYELRPGYEGIAMSADGIHWERAKDEPILSVYDEDCGAWEQSCIYQPWLIEHQDKYYNIYNAANGKVEQMGLAVSEDLLNWKRHPGNPVIPNGPKGAYNEVFSSDIKVFRDEEHWIGFFFGVGRGGAHIMAAYSKDLVNWEVDPEPLYKAGGNPSGIDEKYAHKISLIWNPKDERFYMYYCAVDKDGNRGIGLIRQ